MKIKNYLVTLLTLPTIILTSCNSDNVPESNIIKQEQTGSLNLKINLPEYNSQKEFNTKAESTSFIKGLNLLVENKSFGGTYSQEKNIIPQSTNENVSFSGIPEGQVKVFIEAVGQNDTFLGSNIKENEQGKVITVKANQTNNADLELEVINPSKVIIVKSVPDGTIIVDGNPNDWKDIPVVISDPSGDSNTLNGKTIDLKEIYVAKDSKYFYIRGNYTSSNYSSSELDSGFTFKLKKETTGNNEGDLEFRYFERRNGIWLSKFINGDHEGFNSKYPSVPDSEAKKGEIYELKVPLNSIGNIDNLYFSSSFYCCNNTAFDSTDKLQIKFDSLTNNNTNLGLIKITSEPYISKKDYIALFECASSKEHERKNSFLQNKLLATTIPDNLWTEDVSKSLKSQVLSLSSILVSLGCAID